MYKALFVLSIILLLAGYLAHIGLLLALGWLRLSQNSGFDYLWFCSKILTIKNLIKINHNSQIFYTFSSANSLVGLSTNYNNLLKLVTENGCEEYYRPCGILDTLGNILCIDEEYDCPINEMIVDLSSRKDKYLPLDYKMGELTNSLYNYRLYYTNNNIYGNSSIILIRTEDDEEKPKFISYDSIIIDTDAMKEVFGNVKIKENNNSYSNSVDIEILLKFGLKLLNLDKISDLSKYFANNIVEQNKKIIKKYNEYIKKTYIYVEENNDIYYNHIGDNFYVKNYIGFKNKEDINKFMNFDFDIYKKVFPNRVSAIFALFLSLTLFLMLVPFFCIIKNIPSKSKAFFFTINFSFVHLMISLGFIIYSCVVYTQAYKNKKIEILKTIQSDKLINNFINEFISKFENTKLILSSIIILSSSFLLILLGSIMLCISLREDFNDSSISFDSGRNGI